jgi:hypothetical protein
MARESLALHGTAMASIPWASGLPTERETLLLKAALLRGRAAMDAWACWLRDRDLEHDLTTGERRILPLARGNLAACDEASMDPRIDGLYKRTLYYNSLLLRNLEQVVDMIKLIDVEPLVMKGAALILSGAYEKIGTRVLSDFDLLVPYERRQDVLDHLMREGFQPLERWSWYREPFHQVHSIQLQNGQHGGVDLHWFPMEAVKHEKTNEIFFAEKRLADIGRRRYFVPSPEIQLIQTIAHGLRNDPGTRTQWVCDAVKLIERFPELDWDGVARRAQELRVGAFLRHGVDYLASVFGDTVVSQACRSAVSGVSVTPLERRVFEVMNKPHVGARDLVFLRMQDIRDHRPGRPCIYYLWTLFRYWSHAARVASNGALAREFLVAARRLLTNGSYDMGSYRNRP